MFLALLLAFSTIASGTIYTSNLFCTLSSIIQCSFSHVYTSVEASPVMLGENPYFLGGSYAVLHKCAPRNVTLVCDCYITNNSPSGAYCIVNSTFYSSVVRAGMVSLFDGSVTDFPTTIQSTVSATAADSTTTHTEDNITTTGHTNTTSDSYWNVTNMLNFTSSTIQPYSTTSQFSYTDTNSFSSSTAHTLVYSTTKNYTVVSSPSTTSVVYTPAPLNTTVTSKPICFDCLFGLPINPFGSISLDICPAVRYPLANIGKQCLTMFYNERRSYHISVNSTLADSKPFYYHTYNTSIYYTHGHCGDVHLLDHFGSSLGMSYLTVTSSTCYQDPNRLLPYPFELSGTTVLYRRLGVSYRVTADDYWLLGCSNPVFKTEVTVSPFICILPRTLGTPFRFTYINNTLPHRFITEWTCSKLFSS